MGMETKEMITQIKVSILIVILKTEKGALMMSLDVWRFNPHSYSKNGMTECSAELGVLLVSIPL